MESNNVIQFPLDRLKSRQITLDAAPIGRNPKPCRHDHFLVDEELAEAECADCGAKLNPMFVLIKLARKESRLQQRLEEFNSMSAELDKRKRCKCQHCGKMTNIRGI
ncbi:hypothetical protein JCM14076_06560 [Methylosoma difficile]